MQKTIIRVGDDLYKYILSVSLREPEILKSLRKETAKDPYSSMQISPDQGQFMGLLLKLMGDLKVVEIGTYTGYSALCMALSLPPAGRIITCDVSRKWTAIAEEYWQKAGMNHMIELRIGDALETLDAMIEEGEGRVDLIFYRCRQGKIRRLL